MLNLREITNNREITERDIQELSFYLRQSYERTSMLLVDGYSASEETFRSEDDGVLETILFDENNAEHLKYSQTSIRQNLLLMREAIYSPAPKDFILSNEQISDGVFNGGMNDFLEETVGPCLPIEIINSSCQMEVNMDTQKLFGLIQHFFAVVKISFGSIDNAPDSSFWWDRLSMLGIHHDKYSFRELTLLAGYKTERAIRNLASPSAPEHKRLKIVKEGRKTLVEYEEATRWLASHKLK